MHPEVGELAELAQAVADLLIGYGEHGWGDWFQTDAARIRNLDSYGVEHVIGAYGGLGSVNDLVLHPMNGHSIRNEDIALANEKLASLLAQTSRMAKKLYGEEIDAQHAKK
jgi:hypothetical protein